METILYLTCFAVLAHIVFTTFMFYYRRKILRAMPSTDPVKGDCVIGMHKGKFEKFIISDKGLEVVTPGNIRVYVEKGN